MSEVVDTGLSAGATLDLLAQLHFTHVVMIPDSESAAIYEQASAGDRFDVIVPCREGEGIAIAAGLWTGGAKPVLVIQNTGLMEGGDALRGCGIGPRIPLRLIVGWRGYPGGVAGKLPIDSAYPYTEPLLDAWQIPTRRAMSDADLDAIVEMDAVAAATSLPTAVLTGHGFRP
jgi:sulfopyruvate decarboxylase subunit alpha